MNDRKNVSVFLMKHHPIPTGLITTFLIFLLTVSMASQPAALEGERAQEREAMVRQQIEARGVRDPKVLAAMRKVLRHRFIPDPYRSMAYEDHPVPIGEGQTISQPYIVALMTELAEVEYGKKVLEIGTGSGYQAAVLAEITPYVFTIEILPTLAKQAQATLRKEGYPQVRVRIGDGYLGWPEEAPFDAILVTAAPDHIPQPLLDQLAEGGVMVIPVGPEGAIQQLLRIRKRQGRLEQETIIPVRFVPLIREGNESIDERKSDGKTQRP
jgi:protein-L-isoaspartate(D-aspartate) O-methyltransferase